MSATTSFEDEICGLTRPFNGQYPRPWMTASGDPEHAGVFIVGFNQATTIPACLVSQDSYIDALFNRNGQSLRRLYDGARGDRPPSRTRRNLDALTERLTLRIAPGILETNVVCYATPMSRDLARPEHAGGRDGGTEIFRTLLDRIRPRVLIAHGSATRRRLARILGTALPEAAPPKAEPRGRDIRIFYSDRDYAFWFLPIPSLAPPAWNGWASEAPRYFDRLADLVEARLASR